MNDSNISIYEYDKDMKKNNKTLYKPTFLYDKGHFLTWECSDLILANLRDIILHVKIEKKIEKK